MTRSRDQTPLARLGYAVHVRRARLRISQGQTARRAGMHRNYVGAIERGEINPTYDTLLRLAHGLELPLHELVEQATTTHHVVPVAQRRSGRRAASG